jgi:isocitrate dehydrogenase
MSYQHIAVPAADGERSPCRTGAWWCPTTRSSATSRATDRARHHARPLRIWDAAVQQAYGGRRRIAWLELFAGEKASGVYGSYFPDETLAAIKEFIVAAIKGPLTTPIGGGFRSLNVSLRQLLNLYACWRPVRYYPGVPSPVKHPEKLNVVIFRENTEDVYAGIEYQAGSPRPTARALPARGAARRPAARLGIGIKPISEFGTKRLCARRSVRLSAAARA